MTIPGKSGDSRYRPVTGPSACLKYTKTSIAQSIFATYPLSHGADELACVASTASIGLGANVTEVPAVVVALSHDLLPRVVQRRNELCEETASGFRGQKVPEAPGAAPERRPPVVVELAWRCPVALVSWRGLLQTRT